jgi:TrmH family RNA methyltransferase
MKIESLQNSKVKEWIKLKEKKYRDLNNLFLIEGDHLLNEAMIKGVVREIISTDKLFDFEGIPFYEVNDSIMKKMSNQVSGTNVICVCEKLREREIIGNVCLLDNIQDPGNLGTIIRSAVAFNIDTIIVSPDTVDLYNDKTIRSSEGMLFHINVIKLNLEDAIDSLKNKDYKIYGTNVENGLDLKETSFLNKVAVIIGNEGNGVKKALQDKCDSLIYIPISSSCESLNAGIAASIIFYEMN